MTAAIAHIKERLDIVEIVETSGVQLRKVGRAYQGFCPFHPNTRTPAFTVYPDTQSFYCFGCGASGSVFDYVMRQDGLDFKEALAQLAPRAGVDLAAYRTQQQHERDRQHEKLLEITTLAARYFRYLLVQHPRGQPGRDYVAQRGVDERTAEAFQVGYALGDWGHLLLYLTEKKGYAPADVEAAGLIVQNEQGGYYDRFRGRLIFPIRNERGEVVGFGGRALSTGDPRTPKYLNTPQTALFDKGRVLYGLDQAREAIRTADHAIIVEGYLDVITAHQYGFRTAIAPLGTALTGGQVRLLKKLTRTISFALDADTAGQRAVEKGVQTAQMDTDDARPRVSAQGLVRWESEITLRVIRLPDGSDPDDLIRADPEQWRDLVAGAVPVLDFLIDRATAGRDMRRPADQQQALAALVPMLAQLSGDQQRIYATHLERVIGVRAEHILDMSRRGAGTGERERKYQLSPPSRTPTPVSWEEMLLVLLLHYPSVAGKVEEMLATSLDRFPQVRDLLGGGVEQLLEQVEHRQIWQAAQQGDWRQTLDEMLREDAERLATLPLPVGATERYEEMAAECVRHLRVRQVQQWSRRVAEQMDAQEDDPSDEQLALWSALTQCVSRLQGGRV